MDLPEVKQGKSWRRMVWMKCAVDDDGYGVVRGIEWASLPRQKLDICFIDCEQLCDSDAGERI